MPGAVVLGTGANAKELIANVDFPQFVSDLIGGVFNAIVKATIEQMEAYGELVGQVAQSVDRFLEDEVSEGAARDYLAQHCVRRMDLVRRTEPAPADLTEVALVRGARRRLAMDRQQAVAAMLLKGARGAEGRAAAVAFRLRAPTMRRGAA